MKSNFLNLFILIICLFVGSVNAFKLKFHNETNKAVSIELYMSKGLPSSTSSSALSSPFGASTFSRFSSATASPSGASAKSWNSSALPSPSQASSKSRGSLGSRFSLDDPELIESLSSYKSRKQNKTRSDEIINVKANQEIELDRPEMCLDKIEVVKVIMRKTIEEEKQIINSIIIVPVSPFKSQEFPVDYSDRTFFDINLNSTSLEVVKVAPQGYEDIDIDIELKK